MIRSWIYLGAIVSMLGAGQGLATAQDGVPAGRPDDAATMSFDTTVDEGITGSLGTVGVTHRDILPLSDEQRGWIFLGVTNLPDVPDADLADPVLSSALSDAVKLRDLPAMVTRKIPLVGNYKFVKLEDRILLVDPDSREVVAEIPRYKLVH